MPVRWMSLTEACQSLGVSESTLRRRIKQGEIESKLENGKRVVLIEPDSQATGKSDSVVDELKNQVDWLRQELESRNEHIKSLEDSRERQDTIIMQLTKQLEQSQRMLAAHETEKRDHWWRRWFKREK